MQSENDKHCAFGQKVLSCFQGFSWDFQPNNKTKQHVVLSVFLCDICFMAHIGNDSCVNSSEDYIALYQPALSGHIGRERRDPPAIKQAITTPSIIPFFWLPHSLNPTVYVDPIAYVTHEENWCTILRLFFLKIHMKNWAVSITSSSYNAWKEYHTAPRKKHHGTE